MDAIDPNPEQPRHDFDDDKIRELANSLKSQGVIQPVVVRLVGERYQLIAGERRVRAARLAGLPRIPARVLDGEADRDLEKALVENIQRENLNPIHEALAYKRLRDEQGLTQEEIAERVGKSRVTVTNLLRLLRLSPAIQGDLIAGRLTEGHARALLALESPKAQETLRQEILRRGLTVREAEELAKKRSGGAPERAPAAGPGRPSGPRLEASVQELQESLTLRLGARVQIRARSLKKGSIVIPYNSIEDFERILGLLGVPTSGD